MKNTVFRLVWRAEVEAFEQDVYKIDSDMPPIASEHGMRVPHMVKADDVPTINVYREVTAETMAMADPRVGIFEMIGHDLQRHANHEMNRSGWVENKLGVLIPDLVRKLEVAKRGAIGGMW